jgi:hypothetical protein
MINMKRIADRLGIKEEEALKLFYVFADELSREETDFSDFSLEEASRYKSPLVATDRYILWTQALIWATYEELENGMANRPGQEMDQTS